MTESFRFKFFPRHFSPTRLRASRSGTSRGEETMGGGKNILLRPAAPQGSDQTVKPRPQGPRLQPHGPQGSDQTVKPRPQGPRLQPHGPPPKQPHQPTLNRLTSRPTLNRSLWGGPCVGVTRQWLRQPMGIQVVASAPKRRPM